MTSTPALETTPATAVLVHVRRLLWVCLTFGVW